MFFILQELTVALGLAGTLDFDPRTQKLKSADGSEEFLLEAPYGDELPQVVIWVYYKYMLLSPIAC